MKVRQLTFSITCEGCEQDYDLAEYTSCPQCNQQKWKDFEKDPPKDGQEVIVKTTEQQYKGRVSGRGGISIDFSSKLRHDPFPQVKSWRTT